MRAGVYRCSSPKNLVAMGPAIVMAGRAFGLALTRLHDRRGLGTRCRYDVRPTQVLPRLVHAVPNHPRLPGGHVRDMTNLERRLIDDDGAAPASHYSTIASHRDLRRCHDGGTARPRSPRARPTSSLRERPGRVRSCSSSPLDLTSGGPARGLHAPPGPNGLLRGRHVPPALLPPHRPLTPRVVSSSPPQLIRSCSRLILVVLNDKIRKL